MSEIPFYYRLLRTLARNSFMRDLTFRGNFLIEVAASITWTVLYLAFWLLVFRFTPSIGAGWGRYEFFLFIATTLVVHSLTQTFFLPNADQFTDLVRSGDLDFLLVMPADPLFLVLFRQIRWSALSNFVPGVFLMAISIPHLAVPPSPLAFILWGFYVLCGVAILCGTMVILAATSVWMGRNTTLLDFWFSLTGFSRYPAEIFAGSPLATGLRWVLTFVFPVLLVVNVPATFLVRPLTIETPSDLLLPTVTIVAAAISLYAARRFFHLALRYWRSASS